MSDTLKGKAIKGSLWSFVGMAGHQILGFVVFIFLSRQLGPVEFGLVGTALIIIEFTVPIVSMGLADALIREKQLSKVTENTVFWITSMLGLSISLAIFFGASWLANFFEQPSIVDVIQWLSILPVLSGLSVVQMALLERAFSFKTVAIRQIIASVISGVVAVIMVLNEYGLYSLVAQRIVSAVLLTGMLWYFVPWRPSLQFSSHDAKRLCGMGGNLVLSSLVVNMGRRSIETLIVLFLGPVALGYLRITAKLQDFVLKLGVEPFVKVSLPVFAKMQDDTEGLRSSYLKFVESTGLICLPAFIGLAWIAPELIVWGFGEQWLPSAELLQILSIASISMALNFLFKPLMMAKAWTGKILLMSVIEAVLVIVFVAVAVQYSLSMVVFAQVVSLTIVLLIGQNIIGRTLSLSMMQMLSPLKAPLIASCVMSLVIYGVRTLLYALGLEDMHDAVWVMSLIMVGAMSYLLCIKLCFPHYVQMVKEDILPMLKRKR